MANANGTCFVVMGFGTKTDFESGRTYDLNKSYQNIIKPAALAAGLSCVRADEIVHSGQIEVPMYEQLLNADVVVADLSTSNKNAFYELGIRHALRPHTTVVIAEDGMKTPFDVNHVLVRTYHHLGEDIGVSEANRFIALLTGAIKQILATSPRVPVDSPVYTFLPGLTAPTLSAANKSAIIATPQTLSDPPSVKSVPATVPTHNVAMRQVDDAVKEGNFLKAKTLLAAVRTVMKAEDESRPEDPFILQRLALLTYKSKQPTEVAALNEARELLSSLEPETSNDTETLGLWGAIHKRLWNLTKEKSHLDEAVRAHERGFYLRNDYYNGINFAFLLNLRAASSTDTGEAIADFILARRVRHEVIEICQKWLADNAPQAGEPSDSSAAKQDAMNRYWVLATLGEALLGVEDASARTKLEEAYAAAPEAWMKDTTREQIAKLEPMLAGSPLIHIR